jgi:hypothetical protein
MPNWPSYAPSPEPQTPPARPSGAAAPNLREAEQVSPRHLGRSDDRAMFSVLSIFGGTTDIQKEIIARNLGL